MVPATARRRFIVLIDANDVVATLIGGDASDSCSSEANGLVKRDAKHVVDAGAGLAVLLLARGGGVAYNAACCNVANRLSKTVIGDSTPLKIGKATTTTTTKW